jgi:hypothetical protein
MLKTMLKSFPGLQDFGSKDHPRFGEFPQKQVRITRVVFENKYLKMFIHLDIVFLTFLAFQLRVI